MKIFSVFLAVLLLALPYMVLAGESPPEFASGGGVVMEQNNGLDSGVASSAATSATTGDNEIPPELVSGGGVAVEQNNGLDGGVASSAATSATTGDGEIPPDVIVSEDEFWEWINSNSDNGNVILSNNIVLKTGIMLSGPLSIDTGAYGVTMDGGSIYGDLSVTGDGVDTPVLTVVNMRYSPWDSLLPWYEVTARGKDGDGGVAVHIRSSTNGSPGFLEAQGHIRSEGKGAVGVLFDYPVKAHFFSVSADGEDSVAVSAPDGVSLYYGKLEASGNNSKVVSGGNILLDTCKISGNASGAEIVNRKIVALAGSWLYWPLAQGLDDISDSSLYNTFSRLYQVSYLLSGNEAHPAEVRRIYSQWDLDKIDAVDTSAIGKTVIPGMLYDSYRGLGLEDDFPLGVTVDVRDGDKPCIISLSFGDDIATGRRYVYFDIFDDLSGFGFEPVDGNFILWRSDDEGKSWYDFTDSPDVSLAVGGVTYCYDKITGPAWFCIQEIGGEYSNIAIIHGYEGKTYGSLGGDRTGVDRDGEDSVTSPVPDPKPHPEPEPPTVSASPSRSKSNSSSPYEPSDAAVQTSAGLVSQPPADAPPSTDEIPESSETHDTVTLPDEWENDTTTAVSGKRLRMMMDAGNKVTFIKKEIRLSFDAAALEKLDIGDGQLFTVTVASLEQFKYTAAAALDGMELYSLPCVATLDGNSYDILVSGTYDFTPPTDEQDVIPTQTHSPEPAVTQLSRETADEEKTKSLAGMEEKPSASPPAVFVTLGIGCVMAAAIFVRLRVKKYGR